MALGDLNKEALARLIKTVKAEPAAMPALKQALSDEVVYSVLRHHGLVKPSLHERVEEALASVRPMLAGHGGNVELVEIEAPAVAVIRLLGACHGCPASELTLSEGVEKAIREYCPEITAIKKAKGIGGGSSSGNCSTGEQPVHFISPFARADDQNWTFATSLNDLPEMDMVALEIDGHSLLLSRQSEKVVCYQNACAHLGMPLDMGKLENGILTCPYHAFQFALDSGECLTAPEVQLHAVAVRVQGDKVEVKLE
ncbi:MAG: NifU family protein [Cyanobacteria bacterium REEB67]|nr:NifU family protein [Cyanobacteria bacterium REEB67]